MDLRWDSFLTELVRSAHGEKLPLALQTKMVADLSIQLQQKVHDLVLAQLKTDFERLQYQNLIMGDPTGKDMKTFLEQHLPNAAKHLEQCLNEFRNDYLRLCRVQK